MEKVIAGIALLGVLLSAYSLPLHYTTDSSRLCNIGETLNCDKVNRSVWSEFLGIPVALLGLLAYLLVALLVVKRKMVQKWLGFTEKDYWQYLFFFALAMALFQVYLTLTEIFFIHAYCIICLGSQAVVLALAVLTWREWRS